MQETEKFIEAVKKYPCIWNVYIPTHKCRETKDAAWREIIQDTSITDIGAAKHKWKKLKDAFREAINKRKKDLRQGKLGRPYKFQHVMEFLMPILLSKSSYNELEKCEDPVSNTDDEANECSEQDALEFSQEESEINEPLPSTASQRQGYKRKRSNEILEVFIDNQRKENNTNRPITNQEFDTLDRFFLSMSESTKKLPEHLQLYVKRKVFNAVIEAEEDNMKNMYNLGNESSTEEKYLKPVTLN